MKISSLGLQAFATTARYLNITKASLDLGLTQSALSQRIAQLENELEASLFIREARGLKLTSAGERLLRYTSVNQKLEEDLLLDLQGSQDDLAGHFRVAAYSSILRSVVIPAVAPFLRMHPKIHIDFQAYEMHELPEVLSTTKADLIVMDYSWNKNGIREMQIGEEEFVVIESSHHETPRDLYLDHGPLDNTTEEFFKTQTRTPKSLRRSFMGDIYGIIDGVQLGLGRAVMSRHLIQDHRQIRVVSGYSKYKRPVTVHYFEQAYYSRLMNRILEELRKKSSTFLEIR